MRRRQSYSATAIWGAILVFGLITGSIVRFNAVKLRGRELDEAGQGYAQIVFGSDVEFIVTDRWELGPMAARLWTLGHIATLPILLAIVWLGLPRSEATS